ncbi:MAG: type III PLP-dependent enzyme [Proteobacteria bacterium]|nr:type III PLP-dependent enzyme [Pseudomonadota bacterium]
MRPTYPSVVDLLTKKTTDTPVFCLYPQRIRTAVQEFRHGFSGEVMYAVKANPDPQVVGWVIEGGVTSFDTASLPEIALLRGILPSGRCSYNHPIKPRASITTAYRDFGIRDFVVDHPAELDKVLDCAGRDVVIEVRVAAPNTKAKVSFNEKFGAEPGAAAELMRQIAVRGATPALTMHIGWQTTDPEAFAAAVRVLAAVAEDAAVPPEYVNVGGGFPSLLMPPGQKLQNYFDAIDGAHSDSPSLAGAPLRCEPGSALVTLGGGVLTQVLLIKEGAIYLNDGIYGALGELIHSKFQPPTEVYTPSGGRRTAAARQFRVFGPTCDAADVSPVPFSLPGDVAEGDWLYLGSMGAYSMPLITDFNGLGAHEFVIIDG